MHHDFFVSAAKGLEPLLKSELEKLGLANPRETRSGIFFKAPLEIGYRVCLWSRIASRVLLKLDSFPCISPEDLYRGSRDTDWSRHLDPDSTFAVNFNGSSSELRNTHFAALKVKDAIADQFRECFDQRPSVLTERPDLAIQVRLHREIATLYLDLSGDSLHKRGYRIQGGRAPLKESLAAAMLIKSGWLEICQGGGELIDPMCGSGTLLIEAAMIAGDIAPALARRYFGFLGWKGHQAELWASLNAEAIHRAKRGASRIPSIIGYDISLDAVKIAMENVRNAGLSDHIEIQHRSALSISPSPASTPGLIAFNPPYGERINSDQELASLYAEFGQQLKSHFVDWRVAMLVADTELGFRIGIRSRRPIALYNGAIECKLLNFEVNPERFFTPKSPSSEDTDSESEHVLSRAKALFEKREERAEMFANRLRKNLRNLGRWADREGISCFRLYDADIPEYALAIDLYRAQTLWVHVQEYQAPASVDPALAQTRLLDALSEIPKILKVEWSQIFYKIRRRQKGASQYNRREKPGSFQVVEESGLRFQVNFDSYLDTGLFLDHRITRSLIRQHAKGKRFLNLFGYTGSATVYAASGGAISTTTVDLSKTYLDWTRRNLLLNGFESRAHELVQEDVLAWINQAIRALRSNPRYDLIFLDPPTFSNSKSLDQVFDVQRDHAALLESTSRLLAPNGLLVFSTNFRKFKLAKDCLSGLNIQEISDKTRSRDFERNPKIHRCFEIRWI